MSRKDTKVISLSSLNNSLFNPHLYVVNIFPPVPKSFSQAAEDAHIVKNVQVLLDVVKYVEVVSKILDDYFIYPKVVYKDTQ